MTTLEKLEVILSASAGASITAYRAWLREIAQEVKTYRWHDLRIDPEDLPQFDNGRSKNIAIQMPYGTIVYGDAYYSAADGCWKCAGTDIVYAKDIVIAWAEINPLEEEKR